MSVCGIIAEYNPFHNGHKFHIEKSKELTKADFVVTTISGSFTQRGEPALFDKFTRATIAVNSGVDLVIELPFCFACSPAQFFAEGGVKLLNSLDIVDSICFGSETGDLEILKKSGTASEEIKKYLSQGMSYPSACAAASDMPISTPNDILATEYLRAVSLYAPKMKPFTIKRCDRGYHSTAAKDEFASASHIRSLILEEGVFSAEKYTPAFEIFKTQFEKGNYSDFSLLDNYIIGKLRSGNSMENIAYVSEGLENRFYQMSFDCVTIKELLEKVKTKRYTYARLMRILSCFAVGLTGEALDEFISQGPKYIRILKCSEKGKELLSQIKKSASLPIITTPSSYKELDPLSQKMFELDCRANDIFALTIKNPALRKGRQDFKKLSIF